LTATDTAGTTFDVATLDRQQLERLVILQHRTLGLMITANNTLGAHFPAPTPEQGALLEQWSNAINALLETVDTETAALLGRPSRPN